MKNKLSLDNGLQLSVDDVRRMLQMNRGERIKLAPVHPVDRVNDEWRVHWEKSVEPTARVTRRELERFLSRQGREEFGPI